MKSMDELINYLKGKAEVLGSGEVASASVFVEFLKGKGIPVIIYGAGAVGHDVYDVLRKNNIIPTFFCSGLKGGYVDPLTGISVIYKDELIAYNNGIIILSIGDKASRDEKKQLKRDFFAMGYKESQIMDHYIFEEKVNPAFLLEHEREISKVYDLLSDDESRKVYLQKLRYMVDYIPVKFQCLNMMYTDPDIIHFEENEVIIDAGAYDGDSAVLFRHSAGETADIYSFEPDASNYSDLINRVCDDDKIYPELWGLWKHKDTLCFSEDGNGSSHVEKNGRLEVKVTDLDSYCNEKKIAPTYIKMDIEGAELEAILGAKENIKKNKPKLAICLYHKPEDIYEIPLLIYEFNPLYKMYIRHYSDCRTDTVLYAV